MSEHRWESQSGHSRWVHRAGLLEQSPAESSSPSSSVRAEDGATRRGGPRTASSGPMCRRTGELCRRHRRPAPWQNRSPGMLVRLGGRSVAPRWTLLVPMLQPAPEPNLTQPNPVRPGLARHNPTQHSPAQPSPAQPIPASSDPARPSPAQPSLAEPSPAQPSPA